MEGETIHVHNESSFDKSKLMILMIPVLAFLVVLAVFVTASSYHAPASVDSEASTGVLGTSD